MSLASLGLDNVFTNIGLSFEWTIFIIVFLAAIIMASKSVQIALITLMVSMATLFVWWYNKGYDWTIPFIMFIFSIVLQALMLFFVSNTSKTGGFN